MKKIHLPIIAFMFASASAFAQIPNNGFENWTTSGSYSNPDGWGDINSRTASKSVYTCTKGTPGSSGAAYLKLVSKTVSGMGVMPGIATSGVLDMTTFQPKSGFAFAQRPLKLTGSWQYMASGSDAGYVAVYLTKWNSTKKTRDIISETKKTLSGMAMSWASFSITLTYSSWEMPDSAIIVLSASGTKPVASSYLYVDNLSFSGTATGVNAIENYATTISVYPNPATDQITIELSPKNSATVQLQLIDITGKLIAAVDAGVIQGNYQHTMNTTGIAKGIYFLKVIAGDDVEVKKVVIQ